MSRKLRTAEPAAVPRPGEGKRGPEGHLGYLVRQANVAVRSAMEKVLADLEVTPPQFAVLTMIVSYPGLSGADLARLTFLTPRGGRQRKVGPCLAWPYSPAHGDGQGPGAAQALPRPRDGGRRQDRRPCGPGRGAGGAALAERRGGDTGTMAKTVIPSAARDL